MNAFVNSRRVHGCAPLGEARHRALQKELNAFVDAAGLAPRHINLARPYLLGLPAGLLGNDDPATMIAALIVAHEHLEGRSAETPAWVRLTGRRDREIHAAKLAVLDQLGYDASQLGAANAQAARADEAEAGITPTPTAQAGPRDIERLLQAFEHWRQQAGCAPLDHERRIALGQELQAAVDAVDLIDWKGDPHPLTETHLRLARHYLAALPRDALAREDASTMIAAMKLAHKYFQDENFRHSNWAPKLGIDAERLHAAELSLLGHLNFDASFAGAAEAHEAQARRRDDRRVTEQ